MKDTGILIGLIPLIVYGILMGSHTVAVPGVLGVTTLITFLVGLSDLRKGMILAWATLVLFGSLLITIGIIHVNSPIPLAGILIHAVLAAVIFISILAGVPFTIQYAREMVDHSLWNNPVFTRSTSS